jgi:hypothetical protein
MCSVTFFPGVLYVGTRQAINLAPALAGTALPLLGWSPPGTGTAPRWRRSAGAGSAYDVDAAALVERLRGLRPLALIAVIDLAERMDVATLRGDFEGPERIRREFGISG